MKPPFMPVGQIKAGKMSDSALVVWSWMVSAEHPKGRCPLGRRVQKTTVEFCVSAPRGW